MSEHVARRLDLRKKLLLAVAGILAIAAPIIVGAARATPSRAQSQSEDASASASFDKVSITPSAESAPTPTYAGTKTHMLRMTVGHDGFFAKNVTLRSLIEEAYGVQDNQIVGGPDWLNSATFDISAQLDNADSAKPDLPDRSKNQKRLQNLLADRTKLALHSETRVLPSYALAVSENGSKLQPSQSADSEPIANTGPGPNQQVFMQRVKVGPNGQPEGTHSMRMQMGEGQVVGMNAEGVSISDFASQLSRQLGVNVVDKTGLQGNYNFNLQWKRGADEPPSGINNPSPDNAESVSSLMTAIQEQLGLKLEPQKAPSPVLVIDHVEKPSEN